MTQKFYIKRGDTKPQIVCDLREADKSIPNLTGASVRFKMYRGSTQVVDAAGSALGTPGRVGYAWQAADTAVAGRHIAEWQVTFPDSSVQTYPNKGHIDIEIEKDL